MTRVNIRGWCAERSPPSSGESAFPFLIESMSFVSSALDQAALAAVKSGSRGSIAQISACCGSLSRCCMKTGCGCGARPGAGSCFSHRAGRRDPRADARGAFMGEAPILDGAVECLLAVTEAAYRRLAWPGAWSRTIDWFGRERWRGLSRRMAILTSLTGVASLVKCTLPIPLGVSSPDRAVDATEKMLASAMRGREGLFAERWAGRRPRSC